MNDTVVENKDTETAQEEQVARVYEVGYHILSTVVEDQVDGIVADVRSAIEKAGGSLITEGAPQSLKLAYPMTVHEGGKNSHYDRAYFGWIKFEASPEATKNLNELLNENKNILRFIIFKTVREETRASVRPTTLREVKRSDTIKSTPQKGAEKAENEGEVTEEDLDKAIKDITN